MTRRYLSLSTVTAFLYTTAFTQNLIPNPGFENHDNCLGFNTVVQEWKMPGGKFYHYLSDCPVGKAQYSGEENNKPYEGKSFAGVCLHSREAGEYIMVKLNEPLKNNEEYFFSGHILLAAEKQDNYKNFTHIEIAFTDKEYSVLNPSYISYDPQLNIPVSFENKEKEWLPVSGRFMAKGSETYMVIGDFTATPVAHELSEYMSLSADEREKYLKKHKNLEAAMNEMNAELSKNSKPYNIRCYLDELSLIPASEIKTTPLPQSVAKIEAFKPIIIENIFFETGKSTLLPSSYKALDSLADWLKINPSVEIQITGHTDNVGDEKENNILSSDRATSVKTYLLAKSATNAINTNGLGSTKPIAGNETDTGRSKNRRVEFTITKQ